MSKDEKKIGLIYGLATFIMWGVFPIYFKMLKEVPPLEILAHRFLWSAIFVLLFLKIIGKAKHLKRYILNKKTFFTLTLCGCIISANWGIYIYAVTTDQILEASLGYFINPLMFIILGAIFFKERPSTFGKISIFLAFCAIAVQVINLGRLPFISIILPLSFSIYGLIKKRVNAPTLEGMFCETVILAFVSFAYLLFLDIKNVGYFGMDSMGILLALAGLVTITPLITFNVAAKKLNLSTIGYLQYVTPMITTFLAIFVYDEKFTTVKAVSFALIWLGLILVSLDNYLKKEKNV